MVGVNNTSGSLVLRSDDGNALSSSYMGFEVDGAEKLHITSGGVVKVAGITSTASLTTSHTLMRPLKPICGI